MKALRYSVPSVLASSLLLCSGSAHAHFKLLSPDSWLNEDSSGAPQKGGPCGPGGADDVNPVPMSMKVTEVHAGDTIMVKFDETIHHPGWFRIALAEDPKDFKDPDFPNANCTVDMSTVPTKPHDNVLADGLFMDDSLAGANRNLMQMVTLPDKPCEKCTLQVIQVMADAVHSPPGCVYHHCAELKILPKEGGGAAAGSGGSSSAAAGTGATTSTAGSSAKAGSGAEGGSGAVAAASGGSAAKAAAAGAKATTPASGGSSASTTTTTTASGAAGKPAASTTSGSTSMTAKAGSAAPAMGMTSSPSTSSDSATGAMASGSSGGCAVAGGAADANGMSFALLSLLGLFWAGRRKRA